MQIAQPRGPVARVGVQPRQRMPERVVATGDRQRVRVERDERGQVVAQRQQVVDPDVCMGSSLA